MAAAHGDTAFGNVLSDGGIDMELDEALFIVKLGEIKIVVGVDLDRTVVVESVDQDIAVLEDDHTVVDGIFEISLGAVDSDGSVIGVTGKAGVVTIDIKETCVVEVRTECSIISFGNDSAAVDDCSVEHAVIFQSQSSGGVDLNGSGIVQSGSNHAAVDGDDAVSIVGTGDKCGTVDIESAAVLQISNPHSSVGVGDTGVHKCSEIGITCRIESSGVCNCALESNIAVGVKGAGVGNCAVDRSCSVDVESTGVGVCAVTGDSLVEDQITGCGDLNAAAVGEGFIDGNCSLIDDLESSSLSQDQVLIDTVDDVLTIFRGSGIFHIENIVEHCGSSGSDITGKDQRSSIGTGESSAAQQDIALDRQIIAGIVDDNSTVVGKVGLDGGQIVNGQ